MGSSPPTSDPSPPAQRPGLKIALSIAVMLAILAGITLLLAGGKSKPALPGNATAAKAAGFDGLVLNPARPAPPLNTLRNYDGTAYDLATDRGKAVLLTFLYAHCPDVCPLIASNLHNAYAAMPPAVRARVAIVAVSVDPHRDTAGTVAAFVRQHELAGEARYLIGSAARLVPVWKAWNVGSERDVSRPDLVNHSALVYGISASGKLTTIYASNFKPSDVVHDVPALLAS